MADYPSYATLDETGAVQVTFVPSDTDAIDRVNFYLERSGYYKELRQFFQKLQQTFTLSDIPAGTWTLTAVAATGSSAVEGSSASITITAGETLEQSMASPSSAIGAVTGTTLLNRGNSYSWLGDAEGYFNTRYGASAWAGLSDAVKEQLLITATAQIDTAFTFNEGLAAVREGAKWGFINKKGDLIIDAKFERARSFHDGMAAVILEGKWGYLNKKGEMIIEPKYSEADDFGDGLAPVQLPG